ncbi:MAG: hypothetical protein U0Q15_09505 [Kineosporiaceae bacterium]
MTPTRPPSWGPLPRDVPGYAEAVAGGATPRVPPGPPRPLPGPTARGAFHGFLGRAAVVVVALVLLPDVATRALPPAVAGLAMLVGGVGGLALIVLRLWGAVGRRCVEEFHAGYTTLPLTFGGFGWGEGRRWEGVGRRPPWDYSGLWVLDGTATRVVSAPDPAQDPPGFYPSPHRPGRQELWTGAVWSGRYR